MTRTIAACLLGLVPLVCAHAAGDADAREISAYRLTMEAARKVDVAVVALGRAEAASPTAARKKKLQAELAAIESKEQPTEAEIERLGQIQEELDSLEEGSGLFRNGMTLGEMEAAIKRSPAAAQAVRSAGLTPRELPVFMMCWFQAALAEELLRTKAIKALPPGVSPDNVRFIAENRAELTRIGERWRALGGD